MSFIKCLGFYSGELAFTSQNHHSIMPGCDTSPVANFPSLQLVISAEDLLNLVGAWNKVLMSETISIIDVSDQVCVNTQKLTP